MSKLWLVIGFIIGLVLAEEVMFQYKLGDMCEFDSMGKSQCKCTINRMRMTTPVWRWGHYWEMVINGTTSEPHPEYIVKGVMATLSCRNK